MSTTTPRIVSDNSDSALPDRGELSREDLEMVAEATSQKLLGVSAQEAFAMLERGELDGTLAGSALQSLRFLLAT
jgi:hypothetical protein